MAKYINAAEAAEKVAAATGINIADLMDIFAEIPAADVAPVVDAVEVVRCKDCIYTRKLYGRLMCKYGKCSGYILCEDFFCAAGERRGEEDGCSGNPREGAGAGE